MGGGSAFSKEYKIDYRIMRMKTALSVVLCGFAAMFVGCSGEEKEEVACQVFDLSGCKQQLAPSSVRKDFSSSSYHWVNSGNLEVNRLNVAVNPQISELKADVKVENGRIEINETFVAKPKESACLKDLKFEISGIPSGDYRIFIGERELGHVRIY